MYANIHVLCGKILLKNKIVGNLHPHLKVELKRIIGKVDTFLMKF